MSTTLPAPPPVRVAIAGATGYAGQELLRLLARHPGVRLTAAMSSGGETRKLPALARIWDGDVQPLDVDALTRTSDVVFLGLPEAAAAGIGSALVDRGVRVIDLSGAFRLRDEGLRSRWYPETAALPDGTLYALPERSRASLPGARLVSCPGCYPTAALLSLLPLADAGPAGRRRDYRREVGRVRRGQGGDRSHAFLRESRQRVGVRRVQPPPHGRDGAGARTGRHVRAPPCAAQSRHSRNDLRPRCAGHAQPPRSEPRCTPRTPTRRSCASGTTRLPEIKHAAYTTFCDIGWRVDEATGRLVIVACLDNLLKGAASQAVQNLNLMCGLDERMGLL